jgi:hypothetical protein
MDILGAWAWQAVMRENIVRYEQRFISACIFLNQMKNGGILLSRTAEKSRNGGVRGRLLLSMGRDDGAMALGGHVRHP